MSIIEELELLISKLNSSNNKRRDIVCEEARYFLNSIEPDELRQAERELLDKGVPVENLNKLCSIHLDFYTEDSKPVLCSPGSEIIDVLFHEHEVILDLLEELEAIGHVLQSRPSDESSERDFKRLPSILESLSRVGAHHRREENVIYPELKGKCSPQVLSAEHEHISDELNELSELVTGPITDMKRFSQKAVISINAIVPVWWQHIFKENNILFPCFLDDVTDEKRLGELKMLCDEIGYIELEIRI